MSRASSWARSPVGSGIEGPASSYVLICAVIDRGEGQVGGGDIRDTSVFVQRG